MACKVTPNCQCQSQQQKFASKTNIYLNWQIIVTGMKQDSSTSHSRDMTH